MAKSSNYTSRPMGPDGNIDWPAEENQIWQELVERQLKLLPGRACDAYMEGLELLDLPKDRIPQLEEINAVLRRETGWEVAQVPALINFDEFFRLLANKRFPVATFIRTREEFDYLQEPDIFHEIFGHCPLLTNPAFAHFTQTYGKLGLAASKEDRVYLARLYWFTVEFGLMNTTDGLRIYGGGILSSPGETLYALESEQPERVALDPVEVLRTPYRIDIMQPIYYVIDGMDKLFELADMDIMSLVEKAKALGLHAPKFPPKEKMAS
ncbi:phenylalanine 4-monooxygenase [Aestuariibacter halophilus]|uniref:Phenylalanine-4-hydroxylase n=1 Tax=Fluctibacter halophilus TaxID=226011 RepID=A0ABS8GBS2_9ALTE|nr:phenylalanine 4-monooxygenase [Aestuariibacter halophilus]MCC2616666.1 phenylalanine 4-monooxygenase [Aestuariibacter halophilus]